MSIRLSCKYAKRAVAGREALGEASDATMLECLHAGRLGLDIVCGDINMARPPLSYFKYMSISSRFGRSSGFFSRRSSALLRCSIVAPCSCLLRSVALAVARCAAFPRLEQIEPSVVEGRRV